MKQKLVFKFVKDNLYGDESVAFVAHGNATGETIARIIIPLCDWLGLFWLVENPVSWHCQKQTLHGAGTLGQNCPSNPLGTCSGLSAVCI